MERGTTSRLWMLAALASLLAACGSSSATGGQSAQPSGGLAKVCQGQDGKGTKVGFANLDEKVTFAVSVRQGIQDVAAQCGVNVAVANNATNDQTALTNAQNLATQGVKGVLWFHFDPKISPAVCRTFEGLPVITIDVLLPPCGQLMGADNRFDGEVGGKGMGQYVKTHWNCQIDQIVSFENFVIGPVDHDRMDGQLAGLKSVCPNAQYGQFEPWSATISNSIVTRENAFRIDTAFPTMRDYLTAHPSAKHIVVLCLNAPACQGALSATAQAGRTKDVLLVSQGTDGILDAIRGGQYVGATAYFPECYGRILVPNIIRLINHQKPGNLRLKGVFVDASNINTYYPVGQPLTCRLPIG